MGKKKSEVELPRFNPEATLAMSKEEYQKARMKMYRLLGVSKEYLDGEVVSLLPSCMIMKKTCEEILSRDVADVSDVKSTIVGYPETFKVSKEELEEAARGPSVMDALEKEVMEKIK